MAGERGMRERAAREWGGMGNAQESERGKHVQEDVKGTEVLLYPERAIKQSILYIYIYIWGILCEKGHLPLLHFNF